MCSAETPAQCMRSKIFSAWQRQTSLLKSNAKNNEQIFPNRQPSWTFQSCLLSVASTRVTPIHHLGQDRATNQPTNHYILPWSVFIEVFQAKISPGNSSSSSLPKQQLWSLKQVDDRWKKLRMHKCWNQPQCEYDTFKTLYLVALLEIKASAYLSARSGRKLG